MCYMASSMRLFSVYLVASLKFGSPEHAQCPCRAASIPVVGFNAVLTSEHFGAFFTFAVLHAALAIRYIKVGTTSAAHLLCFTSRPSYVTHISTRSQLLVWLSSHRELLVSLGKPRRPHRAADVCQQHLLLLKSMLRVS